MLVAAALVPDTVLLVPGASGATDVHPDLRRHALDAVRAVLARGPERVVVVAPGAGVEAGQSVRVTRGPVRASLAAAGIPDRALEWVGGAGARARSDGEAGVTQPARVGVSASVGVLLLRAAGWSGPVDVVETAPPTSADPGPAARLAATGRDLVADGSPRTGLVVVGSLSARHGPDAPRADDERAPDYDAAVLADLADAGPDALVRLAALDPALAGALDVSGWAPWQVLVGAVRAAGAGAVLASPVVTPAGVTAAAPLGAQHVVGTWVVAPEPAPDGSPTAAEGSPAVTEGGRTVPAALPTGPSGAGA
ncbi:hypothetical protein [Cellulomonas cellasea]|uniref:Uncharacterized protein n=1 Tax=Cellulomonas cellasea TaxID=43670 RepID=A0A7W4YDZ7_9CELL|nr:hypothetical protein [Cellulomonas cellasea]MBB2925091.1 hypothetical protein [Cellulomonas cellasea]